MKVNRFKLRHAPYSNR